MKHPVTGNWMSLTPEVDGSGMRLSFGPTSNFQLMPGQVVTLTFHVKFKKPGTYPAIGTLYNAAKEPAEPIASFSPTLTVVEKPVWNLYFPIIKK